MTMQPEPPAVVRTVAPRDLRSLWRAVRVTVREAPFVHFRALRKRREWQSVTVRSGLAEARIVLVTVVRDERLRLDYLFDYYRSLGVEHFLLVDNGSLDGVLDHVSQWSDVSTFRATGNFKAARSAIDWVNGILDAHCVGKWVLWIDADELLVFSEDEDANLGQLTRELERLGRRTLQTIMIDMYSARPARENHLDVGQNPLDVCDQFDSSGYRQRFSSDNRTGWIKGGVRERVYFADRIGQGPALNKSPLVHWRRHYVFMKVAHQLWPSRLNGTARLGGALLHFKFTEVAAQKVLDPTRRAVHTTEWAAYDDIDTRVLVDPQLTTTYRGPSDLTELGIIEPFV